MVYVLIMIIALGLDRLIGWPDGLYRRLSHPVVAMGWLIGTCDTYLNRSDWPDYLRRFCGVITVLILISVSGGVALLVVELLPDDVFGTVLITLIAWPFLASHSLHSHVLAVAKPLAAGDIDGARFAVSMIVGRNAEKMDKAAIARAALESLAENTSDGVVAPLFWGVIFGLPGLVVYKAINTMDSMIGYRSERYRDFGWAAARLDDVVNWIPARLTGLIYVLVSPQMRYSYKIMRRDAPRHRSPNAGWPEAAFAAALNLRLSGPRLYDGQMSADPWLNEKGADPDAGDIEKGLDLFNRLIGVIFALLVGLMVILAVLAYKTA
ncbi:MAG: adenosylcobinamide-phosphate synthase CbiB [Candidatus Puniceispirillaceae bacterium]